MAELILRLCRESGFEPKVACRFSNYLLLLQHVEAGRSVTLLPALAIAPSHNLVTRGISRAVARLPTVAPLRLRRGCR